MAHHHHGNIWEGLPLVCKVGLVLVILTLVVAPPVATVVQLILN